MCLAQGPQRSDAGEAWTCGPLVLSQALYHCATVPPCVNQCAFFFVVYSIWNICFEMFKVSWNLWQNRSIYSSIFNPTGCHSEYQQYIDHLLVSSVDTDNLCKLWIQTVWYSGILERIFRKTDFENKSADYKKACKNIMKLQGVLNLFTVKSADPD